MSRAARGTALAGAALMALLAVIAWSGPATASSAPPNAALNGTAVAAGAYVPINVSPNVDFYPAYASSDIDNDTSHGFAGGIYPGFLVDAAGQFYGYGPEERTTLGVSESQFPGLPHSAAAAGSDLGTRCQFMETDMGFPKPFVGSCKEYWGNYGTKYPGEAAGSSTTSNELKSTAQARGSRLTLPQGVTIGSVESSSSSDGADRRSVVSVSTVALKDVVMGPLHIATLKSFVRAVSDGTKKGAKTEHSLTMAGVSLLGQTILAGDSDLKDLANTGVLDEINKRLGVYGFVLSFAPGDSKVGRNESSVASGGLIVSWTGSGEPEQLAGPDKDVCDLLDEQQRAEHAAIKDLTGQDELFSRHVQQDDPLCDAPDPSNPGKCSGRRHFHALPRNFELDITAPPIAPCVSLLLQRDVMTGIALGSTFASAGYLQLPEPPPIDFGGSFGGGFTFPPSPNDRPVGGFGGGVTSPPSGAPAGQQQLVFIAGGDGLTNEVAQKVKVIYAGLALLAALLLIGRSSFRNLIRS